MTNEEQLKEIEARLQNDKPIYIENGWWLVERVRELEHILAMKGGKQDAC